MTIRGVVPSPAMPGTLHAVPSLDEVASKPEVAEDLPRPILAALHARAVRALAALEAPMLDALAVAVPTTDTSRLLDAEAAAQRLQVPTSWVRDQARQGKLPCVKLGHYVRFRASDLDAFVAERVGT